MPMKRGLLYYQKRFICIAGRRDVRSSRPLSPAAKPCERAVSSGEKNFALSAARGTLTGSAETQNARIGLRQRPAIRSGDAAKCVFGERARHSAREILVVFRFPKTPRGLLHAR